MDQEQIESLERHNFAPHIKVEPLRLGGVEKK